MISNDCYRLLVQGDGWEVGSPSNWANWALLWSALTRMKWKTGKQWTGSRGAEARPKGMSSTFWTKGTSPVPSERSRALITRWTSSSTYWPSTPMPFRAELWLIPGRPSWTSWPTAAGYYFQWSSHDSTILFFFSNLFRPPSTSSSKQNA